MLVCEGSIGNDYRVTQNRQQFLDLDLTEYSIYAVLTDLNTILHKLLDSYQQ